MSYIEMEGGNALCGEIKVQGSKNAVLPILAATILHQGTTELRHVPHISDVVHTVQLLEDIGCKVEWKNDKLSVDASSVQNTIISGEQVRKMRSSIIFLGSMLGRMKNVTINYPGGCLIGERPINLHLYGLRRLNAEIMEENDLIFCKTQRLTGTRIKLKYPSVGATENIILAAVKAEGVTILEGAAKEPEITELCNFLQEMGAMIEGAGTSQIRIYGVTKLKSICYTLGADRIVTGTYLVAAASIKSEVSLIGVKPNELEKVLEYIDQMGAKIWVEKEKIHISMKQRQKPVAFIETMPYPGFPTDMQPQFMAALTMAEGNSTIIETIFNARFGQVSELNKMGADILVSGQTAVIRGGNHLHGAVVQAKDLRGGAGMVIAGIMAEGTTRIENPEYINRGYEDICRDFQQLNAKISYKESGLGE